MSSGRLAGETDFPSRYADDANASAGLLFIRAYNLWHTRIKRRLRAMGLTHPQFVVMTTLAYLCRTHASVSQARVAAMADMDVMLVSQIVRNLEKSGFLTRSENPLDTRSYALHLSDKGKTIIKTALPIVEAIDEDFFNGLGECRKTFVALLQRLVTSCDEQAARNDQASAAASASR
jgi:DNA-binding MarR family transcriptional regulator